MGATDAVSDCDEIVGRIFETPGFFDARTLVSQETPGSFAVSRWSQNGHRRRITSQHGLSSCWTSQGRDDWYPPLPQGFSGRGGTSQDVACRSSIPTPGTGRSNGVHTRRSCMASYWGSQSSPDGAARHSSLPSTTRPCTPYQWQNP